MRARGWARLLAPVLVLAFAVLVALGVWQLSRWDGARTLEAAIDVSLAASPLALDAAAVERPPEDMQFRRVLVEGRWDHDRAMRIGNRIRFDTRGENVVVPLLLEGSDGATAALLVDRGWYPLEQREPVLAALASTPTGSVEGFARFATGGSGRLLDSGAWTQFDLAAMAATLPYDVVGWWLIEGELVERDPLERPSTLPVQSYRPFRSTVPHMEYAITWFGLAGALAVTAYLRFVRRRGA